ncbi:ATP synthase protein I [Thiogranum longum]|uniref:ATP synthase protein I n=1 Tax=Thiogranum longum TaxID=1537524 RepID=A0A4R1H8Y3_9GAMM|nr:ATP synthase subunit I [Thiogranum longum]TCK16913.1 ATP synthase protein I [Thiogranum longum]
MEKGIRRLLCYQLVLVLAVSVVFFAIFDSLSAFSVLCGGGIAAGNALLAARCAHRDARAPERTPQQSLAAIYICMVQRFVIIAVLFALVMGGLKLDPLAVLAGFIAGLGVMVIFGTQQLTQQK